MRKYDKEFKEEFKEEAVKLSDEVGVKQAHDRADRCGGCGADDKICDDYCFHGAHTLRVSVHPEAVSYTHLDVYKRQGLDRPQQLGAGVRKTGACGESRRAGVSDRKL